MAEQPDIQIPIVYIGAEDTPILYANQFVAQFQQSEILLLLGQIAPPILIGTEAE